MDETGVWTSHSVDKLRAYWIQYSMAFLLPNVDYAIFILACVVFYNETDFNC